LLLLDKIIIYAESMTNFIYIVLHFSYYFERFAKNAEKWGGVFLLKMNKSQQRFKLHWLY